MIDFSFFRCFCFYFIFRWCLMRFHSIWTNLIYLFNRSLALSLSIILYDFHLIPQLNIKISFYRYFLIDRGESNFYNLIYFIYIYYIYIFIDLHSWIIRQDYMEHEPLYRYHSNKIPKPNFVFSNRYYFIDHLITNLFFMRVVKPYAVNICIMED